MSGSTRFPVPERVHRVEETIRRSRFITTLAHAPDAAAAQAFVSRIREEFPDATHHCWAFVAGPPGSTTHVGMSDDGEPHGSAGRPMLTVLLHAGVGEIVAVSTRYFGGVKLGTGGLSRAYSGGVTRALESLAVTQKVERTPVELEVGYREVDGLQRMIDAMELVILEEEFGRRVRYRLGVPVDDLPDLRRRVADLTRGTGTVIAGKEG